MKVDGESILKILYRDYGHIFEIVDNFESLGSLHHAQYICKHCYMSFYLYHRSFDENEISKNMHDAFVDEFDNLFWLSYIEKYFNRINIIYIQLSKNINLPTCNEYIIKNIIE